MSYASDFAIEISADNSPSLGACRDLGQEVVMMDNGKRKPRRQLSPEEKWEVFLEVTSQEISQADAALKYGVDVSVIVRLRALARLRD
jgi:nicotinate-nucleotide pyrophosphorylase